MHEVQSERETVIPMTAEERAEEQKLIRRLQRMGYTVTVAEPAA